MQRDREIDRNIRREEYQDREIDRNIRREEYQVEVHRGEGHNTSKHILKLLLLHIHIYT
jgi:hypothetical protein